MAFQVGNISYGPHGYRSQSEGLFEGQTVVVIHKHKNHTHTNTGIYSVVVRGAELPYRYRGIDEARRAGHDAFNSGRP